MFLLDLNSKERIETRRGIGREIVARIHSPYPNLTPSCVISSKPALLNILVGVRKNAIK